MADKTEILAKIAELSEEVAGAREALLKGELVSIDRVHDRIEAQCQSIVELEPEDAVDVKPKLDALLDDLKLFSEEIEYVQAKVAEILADAQKGGDEDGSPGT